MVIALASHQCGPGSNPRPDAISGLSLLLVLVFAPRWVEFVVGSRPCSEGFSTVLRFSSLHKNQHFLNSNSIGNLRATSYSVEVLSRVTLVK